MRIILRLTFCLLVLGCAMMPTTSEKINGVSFVASRVAIDSSHVKSVINLNANYAAIMPFGFIRDLNHPEIIFNTERQWFGETKNGAKHYAEVFKKQKVKVMIKPQIWVMRGQFTGDIKMETEEQWLQLQNSYTQFVLEYAQLAQELNAELFCIGTELEQFVINRPEYWHQLIEDIKKIYKGKLTYAANWDEYKHIPFWEELDLIGIDAYFPLSDLQTPSVDDCKNGLKPWKFEMQQLSVALNRKIVFTEFGYRSMDYAAKQPWLADRNTEKVNEQAQANATQAFIEELWFEDWVMGGFIWKWFHNHDEAGGVENNRFTPQNKLAEDVLRAKYLSFN